MLNNQEAILEQQIKSLENEKQMLENEDQMINKLEHTKELLESFQTDVRESFTTVTSKVKEHNQELQTIFSTIHKAVTHIYKLQVGITNDWFKIKSFLFYLVMIFICYIISTPIQIIKYRPHFYALVSVNFVVELFISSICYEVKNPEFVDDLTYYTRMVLITLCFAAFGYAIINYEDITAKNYNLLVEINEKIDNKCDIEERNEEEINEY